jgi:8-amino-7-oxononanoate synthase/acyl carrier protein
MNAPAKDTACIEDVRNKVRAIVAAALGIPSDKIGFEDPIVEKYKLDSLQAMEILAKIEYEYSLLIPDEEYFRCRCIDEIAGAVAKRLGIAGNVEGNGQHIVGEPKAERIVDFSKSREYMAFQARKKSLDKLGNPYFVKHDSKIGDTSIVNGRRILNFGSYNYVCLSGNPVTVKAAQDAAAKYGTSASGSRLLAGDKSLYRELELEIADWKHTEDAIVMVSGHATNVTTVGCMCNEHDLILYDALSHNSITQGTLLSKGQSRSFPHNDVAALEAILKEHRDRFEKVLLIVEGVYSMDGDIAPIPEFVRLKKEYGLILMVDEAHSTCVIGEHGGGVDEYYKLAHDDIDIKMGTLSKGLGTCGGYIAASGSLIEWLMYSAPGFVFSVGISPVLAAACLAGIRELRKDNTAVRKLQANIKCFIEAAKKRHLDTVLAGETAIIPIMVGPDEAAFALSVKMLEKGVFVPPAVFPAVPNGKARLRFCVCSDHLKEQIEEALDCLENTAAQLGIDLPRL